MGTIGNIEKPPSATVQGTGSYTVPAGKYALMRGSCMTVGSISGCMDSAVAEQHSSNLSVNDNGEFWLVAGDSITTAATAPGVTLTLAYTAGLREEAITASADLRVNASKLVATLINVSWLGYGDVSNPLSARTRLETGVWWSVSEYDI